VGIVSDSTDRMGGTIRAAVVPAVLAAAAVWVFSPITRGDFFLDDLVRLYDLKNWGWTKLILSPHGGHLLSTSNASYWLFDRVFGLAPAAWFMVVLAVHVINVLLLYDVTRRVVEDRRVAFLASTLWGVAPIQVGALGWLAAFGNALVAATLLLLLRELTLAAARTRPPSAPRIAWWYVLALLGATSFGFGLAVAMVLPVVGYLFLCGVPGRGRATVWLAGMVGLVPLVYVAQHTLYRAWFDVPLPWAAPVVPPSSPEAVMRAAVDTGRLLVALVSYGVGALLLGAYGYGGDAVDLRLLGEHPVGESFVTLHVLSGLVALCLLLALARAPRQERERTLALVLLLVASYGMVALGSTLTGRTTFLRDHGGDTALLGTVVRYHYVPTLVLALLLAGAAAPLVRRAPSPVVTGMLVVALVVLAPRVRADRGVVAKFVAELHGDPTHYDVLRHLEKAVRETPGRGPVNVQNLPLRVGVYILKTQSMPGWLGVFVIFNDTDSLAGRPLRFVESDAQLRSVLLAEGGTRSARLLVDPERGSRPDRTTGTGKAR
jgi:hypothetical protein